MLRVIVAIVVAAGVTIVWWMVSRPIDVGSVSDAWRAEQRGRKDHDR